MPRIVYTDISGQERSVPFGDAYPVVTIGRATDCTIRSNRKSVSRRHAEFRFANGQFEIVDLNSSNGTYVIINNERKPVVGREFLAMNDEVWCGDFILHFVEDEDDPHRASGPQYDSFSSPTQNASGDYGQSSNDFDYDYNEPFNDSYGGLNDASSAAWGSTHPPTSVDGPDMTTERSSELERLKAERQSIQELAERQSSELEDLQRRLDEERRRNDALEAKSERTSNVPPGDTQRLRDDLARLKEERAAESTLNNRLRGDIERLEDELDAVREEKRKLEEKLHTALQSSERGVDAEAKLDSLRHQNQTLERELDTALTRVAELEDHLDAQANALEERQRYKEEVLARDRDIETLEGEVARLQSELGTLRNAHAQVAAAAEKGRIAIEETDALKREIDRHKRLVEEFERRNRELQADLDGARASSDAVRAASADFESKIDDFEAELEATRAELEAMRRERDRAVASLAELTAKGSIEDLRVEIEGLKQRLKLEKERSKHDDHIATENAQLKSDLATQLDRVAALEGELEVVKNQLAAIPLPTGSAAENLPADVLHAMRDRIDRLDRIVDAIERTNLDGLTIVDRIRLQSAIRDTEPRASLNHLKSLLSDDA